MKQEDLSLASEDLFRTAFDGAPVGMALMGLDGTFLRANEALARITGRPAELLLGSTFEALTHPDDRRDERPLIDQLVGGELPRYEEQRRYLRPDGSSVLVLLKVALTHDDDGTPRHFVAFVQDLRELEAATSAAIAADVRFQTVFDASPIGVAIVDDDRLLRVNPALAALTERPGSTLVGSSFGALWHPQDRARMVAVMATAAEGTALEVEAEARLLRADSAPAEVLVRSASLPTHDGNVTRRVVQVLDITERKHFEARLRHMADHDPLTGLYNRRRLEEELTAALAVAHRYGESGALLLLDLDGFKMVNDSLGHAAGDELIVTTAAVLLGGLRETDVLARLGGDEFAVVLPRVDPLGAELVADKLLDRLRRRASVLRGATQARLTASVGIASFGPGNVLTAEDVLVEADIAMYEAKDAGRDCYRAYDAEHRRRERITQRQQWLTRLRSAPEDGHLELLAQPIVGICGNGIPRLELLLRYRDDDGRLIPPGVFLYLAERFDLVRGLDRWVLTEAVTLLQREHAAGRDIGLSVNLSAKTVSDPDLASFLEDLLDGGAALPEGRLILEITETAAISNVDVVKQFAQTVRAFGCRLALDDFGSGFASFYYLKHLDFDYIKIDGEFVRRLPTSDVDRLVVESVVHLARGLGKSTIAEFVGDDATRDLLRELGVDYGQGYHMGVPERVSEALAAAR